MSWAGQWFHECINTLFLDTMQRPFVLIFLQDILIYSISISCWYLVQVLNRLNSAYLSIEPCLSLQAPWYWLGSLSYLIIYRNLHKQWIDNDDFLEHHLSLTQHFHILMNLWHRISLGILQVFLCYFINEITNSSDEQILTYSSILHKKIIQRMSWNVVWEMKLMHRV